MFLSFAAEQICLMLFRIYENRALEGRVGHSGLVGGRTASSGCIV